MKQLLHLASTEFAVVATTTDDMPRLLHAPTLPIPVWPDGQICFPIASFALELAGNGRATAPSGGTIKTYCCYLSELVRYCSSRLGGDFLRLEDNAFSDLLRKLYEQEASGSPGAKRRNRTTVNKMGAVWLDFLSFYSHQRGEPNFVGLNGSIRAERAQVRTARGLRLTWKHPAFAPADPYNYRNPMAESILTGLRRAVTVLPGPPFQRRRRHTMLELFSVVGLRRIEASLLRVSDVKKTIDDMDAAVRSARARANVSAIDSAAQDQRAKHPFHLRFRMRKQFDRSGERLRSTPVSAATLQLFKEYLKERRLAVRLAGWTDSDDSPFFINLRNGRAYQPNYFTQEFFLLANAVGFRDISCSPHRLRGRFIVNELNRLGYAALLSAKCTDKQFVLEYKDLLGELMEITGHISESSLLVYLKFARLEVMRMSKAMDRVHDSRAMEAIQSAAMRYESQIASGVSAAKAGAELFQACQVAQLLLEARDPDLH